MGILGDRRRGSSRRAQRTHRERRAHRVHVGLFAISQRRPCLVGQRRRQSYQHLPMSQTNTYLLEGDSDADEIVARRPTRLRRPIGRGTSQHGDRDFVSHDGRIHDRDGKITAPLRDCNAHRYGPTSCSASTRPSDFSMTPGTCGKNGQSVTGDRAGHVRLTGVTIGGAAA